MEQLKKIYVRIFIFIIVLVLLVLSWFIVNSKVKNNYIKDNYIYNGNISYNVISKNNSSSQDQKMFVSSIVDSISTNFNYKYTHDTTDKLKYRYEIIASVISNVDDSKAEFTEVYRKDEILKKTDYKYEDNISINEHLNLDYKYYNDIALEYDNSVNIAIKSKLLVSLNLYVDYDNEEKVYKSSLTLPLEKPTFSITTIDGNDSGYILGSEKNQTKVIINIVFSFILIIVVLILGYELTKIFKYKKEHILEFKYRKIMQDYNNIVVPIPEIPNDKSITLIRVLYFKSMIDIQKELHVPILCYRNEQYTIYLIINQKLGYVYFLNNEKEKI